MASVLSLTNYVKFIRGTTAAFNKLAEKDKDTLYFISDNDTSGLLYLGNKLISGGDSSSSTTSITLADVQDVLFGDNLDTNHALVYDAELQKWVNKPIAEALEGVVSSTKVYETTLETNETQEQALIRVVGESELHNGDIAVIKELIASDKYQYTAYVYDGENSAWIAMDGNYSAENVYFKEDLLTTTEVGVIELTNGQATIQAAGKNLKEVFNTIFVKEQNPETTNPKVTVTLLKSGAYEVGTTVSGLSFSASCNDGNYTYGPDPTGVEVESWVASSTAGEEFTSNSGDLNDVLVVDGINYKVTATATYTEGDVPITNTGNPYEDGKIEAGTASGTSSAITGYRSYFYGPDASGAAIDSDFIRTNLTNSKSALSSKTISWKASTTPGIVRYIVAIPSASGKKVKTAIITSSMNANALDDYKEQTSTVDVEGADGYDAVAYKVWIYKPASIADVEEHTITLG